MADLRVFAHSRPPISFLQELAAKSVCLILSESPEPHRQTISNGRNHGLTFSTAAPVLNQPRNSAFGGAKMDAPIPMLPCSVSMDQSSLPQ
jgi:hypothetical protein